MPRSLFRKTCLEMQGASLDPPRREVMPQLWIQQPIAPRKFGTAQSVDSCAAPRSAALPRPLTNLPRQTAKFHRGLDAAAQDGNLLPSLKQLVGQIGQR